VLKQEPAGARREPRWRNPRRLRREGRQSHEVPHGITWMSDFHIRAVALGRLSGGDVGPDAYSILSRRHQSVSPVSRLDASGGQDPGCEGGGTY
jgi:hypothetical protein